MSKTETRFVDFRAVKAAVSMEKVLNHYGALERFTRGNDSLSGPCPIHGGTNPTQFRVSLSKNCWNCFGDCHGGGNVLDFVVRMENVEPKEAAHRLVEWFNLNLASNNESTHRGTRPPRLAMSEAKRTSNERRECVPRPGPDTGRDRPMPGIAKTPAEELGVNRPLGFQLELDTSHPYLAERGLTPEAIAHFGIGYCGRGVMCQRIAIPIHNAKGELVGYAGRWAGEPPESRPKYRLPDGFKKSVEVYRLFAALKESPELPLVIVEGFFDVMRLWQLGIRKTVALMGSSMSAAQESLLIEHLSPQSRVVVMFDQDEAGIRGREDVLQRLSLRTYIRTVTFAQSGYQPENLTAEEAQLLKLA